MASGHNPHFWVLLGGSINDFSDAEFFKHARDKAKVISDLRAVLLRRQWDIRAV